jgi:murein L,D-transpeptidase YafK
VRLLLVILGLGLVATALTWRLSSSMNASANTPTPVQGTPANEGKSNPTTTTTPAVDDRVAIARSRHGESIKQQCVEAGLNYPPGQLFIRAFKHEGEVEAWGRDNSEPMKLIKTWQLTAQSGVPGPKRREGDRQIPEGCYQVVAFNPKSNYHLSLGLDYPNAADRVHSDREKPGFDIYIHGSNVSIGCLAIGDDMIEELYLLAADFRGERKDAIPVHIFPARMKGSEWEDLRVWYPQLVNFWGELEPIYRAFESSGRVPAVQISKSGEYEVAKQE